MSALTRLEALSICQTDYEREGMALLERLPRLQSAAFSSCFALPGCLSRLTGLLRLCLNQQTVYARDVDALPHLSQLTCLALMGVTDEDGALAAALPDMPQLRALAWFVYGAEVPHEVGQPLLPVPSGPWLGSLQHLEADYWHLAAALPCATSLQQLSLAADWLSGEAMSRLTGVVRCAAALPLLRELNVHVDWSTITAPPASVLEALADSRLRLQWIQTDLLNDSALQHLFYDDGE